MKVEELKNYGKSYAELFLEPEFAKRIQDEMTIVLKKELGRLGAIRFWWRMRQEIKRIKNRDWSRLKARGVSPEVLDFAIQLLAVPKTLVDMKGMAETEEIYHRSFLEKVYEIYTILYPSVNEFEECGDFLKCFKEYLRASMDANKSDGIYEIEELEDTEDVWTFQAPYCIWLEVAKEFGNPYLCYLSSCLNDITFFTRFADQAGFKFKRKGYRSRGAPTCDYKFERLARAKSTSRKRARRGRKTSTK